MTISEIAKLAGVSSAAVSRYFNNGYLSEEKRNAIKKAVEETGYRPSLQAQTLRTKKTKLIGVIIPRIASSSIGSILAGILSETNANGYQILLAVTENNPKKELEYLSVFDEKQVDAVILVATILTPAHKKTLKNITLPIVLVGQRLKGHNCVYHDDYGAEYAVTKHVLSMGRSRVGFIGVTKQDYAVGAERYRGFCEAAADHGLPELSENYTIADFSIESGYENAKKLFQLHPDLDAVICATDEISTGVSRYLKEQGKRIPEDTMVAGHGASELSVVNEPQLTTVRYFYEDSGRRAARLILDNLLKNDRTIQEIKLEYRLVIRASTAAEQFAQTESHHNPSSGLQ